MTTGIEIGRAMLVWNEGDVMEKKVLEVIDSLKKELNRRGIATVTEEEEEAMDDDVSLSNILILFVTPGFLQNRSYKDVRLLQTKFRTAYCSAIIVGDPSFVKFIVYATDIRAPLTHPTHNISTHDVFRSLESIMCASYLKYKAVVLEDWPMMPPNTNPDVSEASWEEDETFIDPLDVQTYAQNAVALLNRMLIDYDKLHLKSIVDIKLIDKHIQLDRQKALNSHLLDHDHDIIFFLLIGCQCRCPDMSSLSKVLYNLNLINYRHFPIARILSTSKIHDIHTDPLALQNAILPRCVFENPKMSHYRLERIKNPERCLVLVEELNFSRPAFALTQLKNLSYMLARGSLVIITTTFTEELADYIYNKKVVSFLRGTTCKNEANWRVFSTRISKSEILGLDTREPEKEAEAQEPKAPQLPMSNMEVAVIRNTHSAQEVVPASAGKKPKITQS